MTVDSARAILVGVKLLGAALLWAIGQLAAPANDADQDAPANGSQASDGQADTQAGTEAEAWHAQLLALMTVVPEADPNAWAVIPAAFSDDETARFFAALGVKPGSDRVSPPRAFYVARAADGRFLGVVARLTSADSTGDAAGPPVTVAVTPQGRIADVTAPPRLAPLRQQLLGRNLACSFRVRRRGLVAVEGAESESRRLATLAHAALVAMQIALGDSDATPLPCAP